MISLNTQDNVSRIEGEFLFLKTFSCLQLRYPRQILVPPDGVPQLPIESGRRRENIHPNSNNTRVKIAKSFKYNRHNSNFWLPFAPNICYLSNVFGTVRLWVARWTNPRNNQNTTSILKKKTDLIYSSGLTVY